MAKQERIRLIYAVFLSLFIVAVGITLIAVCADIYYSGKGTGTIYTREIVGEKLKMLSIPLVMLIAAVIAGAVFPLVIKKPKNDNKDAVLKKLSAKIPAGGNETFEEEKKKFDKVNKIRLILWLSALGVVFACSVACLVYLCIKSNFRGANTEAVYDEILKMVSIFLPLTLISIAACAGVSIYNGVLIERQIKSVKAMIVNGNGEIKEPSDFTKRVEAVKAVASSRLTLWIVRAVIFIVAVTFIILGIFNGGADDVLGKAVNICTECIGLR